MSHVFYSQNLPVSELGIFCLSFVSTLNRNGLLISLEKYLLFLLVFNILIEVKVIKNETNITDVEQNKLTQSKYICVIHTQVKN